jgi:hypothetical protein
MYRSSPVFVAVALGLVACGGKGGGTSSSLPASQPPPLQATGFASVWANDGGDKVTQEEHRGTTNSASVLNRVWDGRAIHLFGAKNEVVSFNLVLEAPSAPLDSVSVKLQTLTGPGGAVIQSTPAEGDGVFDWTNRDIELFYVRYLPISGLSQNSYETYDERHIPLKMRRPWTGNGTGQGGWSDRPNHDKFYPDIAVPLELVPSFKIAANRNQSIWADVYIPKTAVTGTYSGMVSLFVSGVLSAQIPVQLQVRNFTLPDVPASKTMLYLGDNEINYRYTGTSSPASGSSQDTLMKTVRDRHFQLAHRHKIQVIDSNYGTSSWSTDAPRPEWGPRLDGSLFTAAHGYRGPGEATGNGVFSIGTYGEWSWQGGTEAQMWTHTNNWEQWFETNSPGTERFLYLIDESTNYAQTQQWASWMSANAGVGKNLMSFATLDLPAALANVPALNIATSGLEVGDTSTWQNAANSVQSTPGKRFYMYNGHRPASGSFATEDDGVALRELAWGQYKKGISRWFFWAATYYDDTQSGRGLNDLFNNALTYGTVTSYDAVVGETGWNHSNGDGVLMYPGTDTAFPADSYGVDGPMASLRLKHWRRGIQDVDYLSLAAAINPAAVQAIINAAVPKVLWENGVANPSDPTYQLCDVSWSTDPDTWESYRAQLAHIIDGL